jgi:hypothetical protein
VTALQGGRCDPRQGIARRELPRNPQELAPHCVALRLVFEKTARHMDDPVDTGTLLPQLRDDSAAEDEVREPDGFRLDQAEADDRSDDPQGKRGDPVDDDHRHAEQGGLQRCRPGGEDDDVGGPHRLMAVGDQTYALAEIARLHFRLDAVPIRGVRHRHDDAQAIARAAHLTCRIEQDAG